MYSTPIHAPIRVSDFFPYRDNELHAEEVAVSQIATAIGTPFYLYSSAAFIAQYRRFAEAFSNERPLICYAVKANSNLAVLRLFASLGAGADVVSEGELRRALAAGIPPERVLFSGVGKTRAEIEAALDAKIHQINVEVGAGDTPAERGRRARAGRADRDQGQPGRGRAHPRQNLDRLEREQIRHRSWRGGCRLQPRPRASRHRAGRSSRPHRLAARRS